MPGAVNHANTPNGGAARHDTRPFTSRFTYGPSCETCGNDDKTAVVAPSTHVRDMHASSRARMEAHGNASTMRESISMAALNEEVDHQDDAASALALIERFFHRQFGCADLSSVTTKSSRRFLPIHIAICEGASLSVVQHIVDAAPLTLGAAIFEGASLSVVQHIVDAVPQALGAAAIQTGETKASDSSDERPRRLVLTPLAIACLQGNVDVVRLLLRAGVDCSLEYGYNVIKACPMEIACKRGHLDLVECRKLTPPECPTSNVRA